MASFWSQHVCMFSHTHVPRQLWTSHKHAHTPRIHILQTYKCNESNHIYPHRNSCTCIQTHIQQRCLDVIPQRQNVQLELRRKLRNPWTPVCAMDTLVTTTWLIPILRFTHLSTKVWLWSGHLSTCWYAPKTFAPYASAWLNWPPMYAGCKAMWSHLTFIITGKSGCCYYLSLASEGCYDPVKVPKLINDRAIIKISKIYVWFIVKTGPGVPREVDM